MSLTIIQDPHFGVYTIGATPNPQTLVYLALHQDYSENAVYDCIPPSEQKCGEIAVDRCIKYGHWGVLEHPQIAVNVVGFPHSVMQQARTHRLMSYDVASGRYSGKRFSWAASGEKDIEEILYFRPVGSYVDRKGHKYEYTESDRNADKARCLESCKEYARKMDAGYSEEHARSMMPFDFRQNFVVSANLRSWLHFLDLRLKPDAQAEIQTMAQMTLDRLQEWAPQILDWYIKNRSTKGRLAP